MNHVDEGTIQAWLDGALDAAQSVEIEAHVKACADCAAQVAEARGLIAASSRILTALDDVPSNVIPKAAAVPPARRRRSIAPWLSGLAAAVVLVTLWRTGGVEQKPVTQITIPQVQVTPVLPEPSLERLKEPAPPVAARPSSAAPRRQERQEAGIGSVAGRVAGAGAAAGAGVAATSVASAPSEALVAREMRQANDARKDEVFPLMGCYRVGNVALLDQIAEQAQPKSTAGAVTRAAAPAAAPAAAMQKASADMAMSVLAVRLDSGNVVRMTGSDSTIGSWTMAGDSARVVIRGQATMLAPSGKVRCP